jgi:polyisoprenoid-binding protein YceI
MQTSRKIVIGVGALLIVVVGVFLLWILVLRDDAPAALDSGDLDAALASTTVAAVTVPESIAETVPETVVTTTPETVVTTAAPADTGADGVWSVAADSTLGYRVQEVLGGIDVEGAGRTSDVTGSLTIAGTQATAAEFTVQMASITSDSDRRDGQFRGRIMSVDQFPTATFVLTAPIDFGAVPAEGESLTATATGDLTLRGVTRSVTFDVEAKLEGGRIGVLGSIPILFSDYSIPDPSNGFAVVKDNGLLEFVLIFDRG